jgi:divalent metal cation (Fe/Co/Zn/Cd) transporter
VCPGPGSDASPLTGRAACAAHGPTLIFVDPHARRRLTRRAILACAVSVAWALAAGIAAIGTGVTAGSVGLLAFGLDSLVDGTASGVLIWRFSMEAQSEADHERIEHIAVRLIGAALVISAIYVTIQAIVELANQSGPASTTVGLALAGASVLVLPVLAAVKLRLARDLGSGALRGDGVLSAAGAGLAAATLLGLALAGALGWWWADSAAALVIAAALAREGRVALSASD